MKTKQKLTEKTGAWLHMVAAFALTAWLWSGCSSPLLEPVSAPEAESGMLLQLQMEEPDTKVNVNDASGKCTWTPSDNMPDTIAVWVAGTGANKYTSCVVEKDKISSSNATVGNIVLPLGDGQSRSRYAVYPASAAVTAASGSDDGSVNPQVTYNTHYDLSQLEASLLAEYTRLPMVAKNGDNLTPTLAFCHVGGMLRLSLKGIPSGATVAVSFEGMEHVTGTYEVLDAGTTGGRTKGTPVSGKGKTVHIKLPAAVSGSCVVNVPLPCGDYGTLTGVRVKAGTQERVKYAAWPFITHAMGKKLECDFNTPVGPIDRLVLGTGPDATLWKDQKVTRQAHAYDADGNEVTTGVSIAWSSGNTAVATVNPSTGEVTAASAGQAVITATATAGSVTKTASYTVYVNELTGLVLDCGSTLTLRLGVSKPVTATAVYTMNGDPEPPVVNWYVTGPASPAKTATASGTANRFTALTQGSGTITAKIEPENTYGTHPELVATCNFDAIPVTYLPGKFSVSPTEQVYFAPGNLQVNYTGTSGGGHTREWLFSENQWDVFFLTEDELNSLPNPPAGTTVKLSHFGWGTAGHKNPGGDYGYDENHLHYEPHSNSSQEYKYCPSTATWWLKTSGNPNIGYLTLNHEKNTWNADPELRSYCDWGIHFDDNGVGHDDKYDGTWFTLSYRQWLYLAQERSSAKEKISSALLVVDNAAEIKIPGLVLVPDDWQCPAGCEFDYMAFALGGTHEGAEYYYSKNVYYINTTWPLMEASGAVFLPVAGYRYHQPSNGQLYNPSPVWGTSPYYNTQGSYWTSTAEATSSDINQAPTMGFHSTGILGNLQYQHQARAVRLVHYAN